MANTVNLHAEQNANMIGDDAQPALTIENSSTGVALQASGKTGSSIKALGDNSTGAALELVASSTASQAVVKVGAQDSGGIVSTASAGATLAYGIRVTDGTTAGWIPVYLDIDAA